MHVVRAAAAGAHDKCEFGVAVRTGGHCQVGGDRPEFGSSPKEISSPLTCSWNVRESHAASPTPSFKMFVRGLRPTSALAILANAAS